MNRNARVQQISLMRRRLEKFGFPRLRMMLIVAITGGVGFVASYCLLRNGMTGMATRYFVASCCAYLAFIMLLWLWLRTSADDYVDAPDLSGLPDLPRSSASQHGTFEGHGGDFGGGGSSSSFDSVDPTDSVVSHASDLVSGAAEAEELAIPVVLLLLVASLLLSSLFIVYYAPVLFAELLVDGVLAAGLYSRLRRIDSPHWLQTALQRTFWPFAATTIVAVSCGWALQHYVPQAESVGDVMLFIKQN